MEGRKREEREGKDEWDVRGKEEGNRMGGNGEMKGSEGKQKRKEKVGSGRGWRERGGKGQSVQERTCDVTFQISRHWYLLSPPSGKSCRNASILTKMWEAPVPIPLATMVKCCMREQWRRQSRQVIARSL